MPWPMLALFVAFLTVQADPSMAGSAPVPSRLTNTNSSSISIRQVREMNRIIEVDGWTSCPPTAFTSQIDDAVASWVRIRPEVEKALTPSLVRSLSRWAIPQMTAYRKVPSLEKVSWTAVSTDNATGQVVIETTVDRLPTHSPLVTRWLKLFLVYDPAKGAFPSVIVTIRGELLE